MGYASWHHLSSGCQLCHQDIFSPAIVKGFGRQDFGVDRSRTLLGIQRQMLSCQVCNSRTSSLQCYCLSILDIHGAEERYVKEMGPIPKVMVSVMKSGPSDTFVYTGTGIDLCDVHANNLGSLTRMSVCNRPLAVL